VEDTAQALLRGLVRGDEDPFDVVRRLGGIVSGSAGSLRLQLDPDFPTVELPLSDLAHGLLVHCSRGSTLQQWASVALCLNAIQFVEAESPEEDRLLEALWDASAGQPIADHDLSLARTLTS
jgi:hypothetical protein